MDLAGSLGSLTGWITQTASDTLDSAFAVVGALTEEIKEGLQDEPTPLEITLPSDYIFDTEVAVLSQDALLLLFSWLDPASLCTFSITCKKLYLVINEQKVWKMFFERDIQVWQAFWSESSLTTTLPRSLRATGAKLYSFITGVNSSEESDSDSEGSLVNVETWKQRYKRQFKYNSPAYYKWAKSHQKVVPNEGKSYHRYTDSQASLPMEIVFGFVYADEATYFLSKTYKILVVGRCLESSGKGLVYEIMWSENTPFEMTGLYPGQDGIGSGVGFNFMGNKLNLSAIYYDETKWEQKWIALCSQADGICYVIDGYGDLGQSKEEMGRLFDPVIGIHPETPLLVLSCTCSTGEYPTIPPAFIAEELGLSSMSRDWMVRLATPFPTLEGVWESFEWLVSTITSQNIL